MGFLRVSGHAILLPTTEYWHLFGRFDGDSSRIEAHIVGKEVSRVKDHGTRHSVFASRYST